MAQTRKPTGGPYICEQMPPWTACGGNDATLTLQAVTIIETGPCGRMRRLRGAVVRVLTRFVLKIHAKGSA